uniref:Putative secreted protein n=1 Tax=Anopheles darlingi TaxID=43151 RepID=A0A2M4D977_ANODA
MFPLFLLLSLLYLVCEQPTANGNKMHGKAGFAGLAWPRNCCRWQRFSEYGYQKPQIISQITGVCSWSET